MIPRFTAMHWSVRMCIFSPYSRVRTSRRRPSSGLWCRHAWFAVQPPVHVCSYMPCLLAVLSQKEECFIIIFGLTASRIKHCRLPACQRGKHLHTEGSVIWNRWYSNDYCSVLRTVSCHCHVSNLALLLAGLKPTCTEWRTKPKSKIFFF